MTTNETSLPQIADIAPLPWEASLHNQLVDSTGRGLLTIHDYWIGERDNEAVHDDDATRAIAWCVLDAINTYPQLVAVLQRLHSVLDFEQPMTSDAPDRSEINAAFADAYAVLCTVEGRPDDAALAAWRNGQERRP